MQERIEFQNSRGNKLVGLLSNPGSDHVVIISHGYSSSKDRVLYTDLEVILNNLGLASFRFDYTGQGESEGEIEFFTLTQAVDDLAVACLTIMPKFCKYSFVGSSFGGTASGIIASEKQESVFNIFLFTPFNYKFHMDSIDKDIIKEWESIGYLQKTNSHGMEYKRGIGLYSDAANWNGFDYLAEIKSPCLIVYGENDEHVPPIQAKKAHVKLQNSELFAVINGGHVMRFQKYPKLKDIVIQFINKHK